jgi:hypothetical protein
MNRLKSTIPGYLDLNSMLGQYNFMIEGGVRDRN